MMNLRKLENISPETCDTKDFTQRFFAGVLALFAIGSFYLFYRRRVQRPVPPGKRINIEIRYEIEKDADATLLAQNLVKIIRIVLAPLERKIEKEGAALVFVFGGEYWEIRVKNGSADLKQSIRDILEAKEW